MKIACSLSSIEFTVEHFPATLYSREAYHPAFNLPQKKLLAMLGKWATPDALSPTDKYLLFLALLRSTDLVEFRVPAIQTDKTQSLIAQNMENLCRTVIKLNTVTNPAVIFPHYAIGTETKDLSNVRYWIENWADKYNEFKSGKIRDLDDRDDWKRLQLREAALQRLIKNPHREISTYSSQIAEWASLAGSFPTFTLSNPFTRTDTISCNEYWKLLIHKAAHEEGIFAIRRKDLEELLEHCEENIPVGSIYSNALFKILRHALERQKNFLGLGDLDIGAGTYELLSSSDSVEHANLRAMIQSAPEHSPRQEEYPNKLAYLKAKLRWDMSLKFKKASEKPLSLKDLPEGDF